MFGILNSYGLDAAISSQDDPCLWASVLNEHWPRATPRKLRRYALYFDVAVFDKEQCLTHLKSIESWAIERAGSGRFRAEKASQPIPHWCAPRGLETPLRYLHIAITRPSKEQREAYVFHARVDGLRSGFGATRIWRYHEPDRWRKNGRWKQKWGYVAGWIS